MIQVYYVTSLKAPLFLLLASQVLSQLYLLPVFLQLIVTSFCCVFAGAVVSASVQKSRNYMQLEREWIVPEVEERDRLIEVLKYPFSASIMLLVLYLSYKHFSQTLLQLILNSAFIIFCTYFLTDRSYSHIKQLIHTLFCQLCHLKKLFGKYLSKEKTIQMASFSIAFIVSFSLVMIYIYTRSSALNNLFAILLTLEAIKMTNLHSFKVALLLLWLLVAYDIFWVYGTDVMVTVAKSINLPLKVQFPYLLAEEGVFVQKVSMLGLGDMVIPGGFIAVGLKYDVDIGIKSQKIKHLSEINMRLFKILISFYSLGIISTYAAMHIFHHPQPALIFIVPSCSLGLLYFCWKYEEEKMFSQKN